MGPISYDDIYLPFSKIMCLSVLPSAKGYSMIVTFSIDVGCVPMNFSDFTGLTQRSQVQSHQQLPNDLLRFHSADPKVTGSIPPVASQ